VPRQRRAAPALAGLVYLLFAGACFHLIGRDDAPGLALGEGLFTLLGAIGLLAAAVVSRRRATVALLATLPLVGWFLATPYNSGPPFLIASLVAPAVAAAVGLVALRRQAA
jgi:hypothetical protein